MTYASHFPFGEKLTGINGPKERTLRASSTDRGLAFCARVTGGTAKAHHAKAKGITSCELVLDSSLNRRLHGCCATASKRKIICWLFDGWGFGRQAQKNSFNATWIE